MTNTYFTLSTCFYIKNRPLCICTTILYPPVSDELNARCRLPATRYLLYLTRLVSPKQRETNMATLDTLMSPTSPALSIQIQIRNQLETTTVIKGFHFSSFALKLLFPPLSYTRLLSNEVQAVHCKLVILKIRTTDKLKGCFFSGISDDSDR